MAVLATPLDKRPPLTPSLSSPVGLLGNNHNAQAQADDAALGMRDEHPATWRGSVSANNYVDVRVFDRLQSNPAQIRMRLLRNAGPISDATATASGADEDDLQYIRRTRSAFERTASLPVRHLSRGPAPPPGPFFEMVKANYHPSIEAGSNELLPLATSKPQPNGMTLRLTRTAGGLQRYASVPAHALSTYAASRSDLETPELDVLGVKPAAEHEGALGAQEVDSVLARWAEEDEEAAFGSDDATSSSSDEDETVNPHAPMTAPYVQPVPSHQHPKLGAPVRPERIGGGGTPFARRAFRSAQSAPVGALEFGRAAAARPAGADDLDADAPWRKIDFSKYFDPEHVDF